MTGLEIIRVVENFTGENYKDYEVQLPHHDLMEELLGNGNPFEEHTGDLITLDNKVCESAAAAILVQSVESLWQEQYSNFTDKMCLTLITHIWHHRSSKTICF